jgi:Cytochrome c554 and c-prime
MANSQCEVFTHPNDSGVLVYRWCKAFILCVVWVGLYSVISYQHSSAKDTGSGGISLSTEIRVHSPGWWPTKGTADRNEYVGAAACLQCHASKATQQNTPMAHAGRIGTSKVLREHKNLSFQLGPYAYEIATSDRKSLLDVVYGPSTLSLPLSWSFGAGLLGQTYVYQVNGGFYESQVSYYRDSQGLDITAGHSRTVPDTLRDAAGERMSTLKTRECFGCHMTASTTANQFDPSHLIPGVTCEACHGPGASHVIATKLGQDEQSAALTFNPKRLNPVDSVDFCGACHRSTADVIEGDQTAIGIFNVRFAPYRLEKSRCWGTGDARLTCIACHDPHQPLVRDVSSYDSRCLQCHVLKGTKVSRSHPGAACPMSANNCVTCHMPKIKSATQHATFTDHWIRIARAGEPYPD